MPSYASSLVRLLVAVPLLVAIAGCAGERSDAGAPVPGVVSPGVDQVWEQQAGVDPAVLQAWADFPVDRKPRPILLLGPAVRESGYHTDEAKIAFATGRLQLAAALPAGPAAIATTLPDGVYELPAVTAAQAYEQLRAVGSPQNAPDATPTPLRITKVTLGTASFDTDRGALTLPAWLFEAPDSFEPLAVPALAASAFWKHDAVVSPSFAEASVLSADGLTLSVQLPAPHPTACPGEPLLRYVAEVAESGSAVAVGVRSEVISIQPGARRDDCGYDMMLRSAQYEVKLAAPLGNRVLLGPGGGPVPVG